MEPENFNQETPEVQQTRSLHQVTPLSKYLAMALFIVLPFVGGYIGYMYAPEKVVEVEKEVIKEVLVNQEGDEILQVSPRELTEEDIEIITKNTLESIFLEPENPAHYYRLGILYGSSGETDSAVIAFERAVDLDERFSNARWFLAMGYFEQGKREEAVEQLERVSELNPDNEDVKTIIENIKAGIISPPALADEVQSSTE